MQVAYGGDPVLGSIRMAVLFENNQLHIACPLCHEMVSTVPLVSEVPSARLRGGPVRGFAQAECKNCGSVYRAFADRTIDLDFDSFRSEDLRRINRWLEAWLCDDVKGSVELDVSFDS